MFYFLRFLIFTHLKRFVLIALNKVFEYEIYVALLNQKNKKLNPIAEQLTLNKLQHIVKKGLVIGLIHVVGRAKVFYCYAAFILLVSG